MSTLHKYMMRAARDVLSFIRPYRKNSLSIKIMSLCIGVTVGALVLTCAPLEWQDTSADRADLIKDQLSDARSLATAASLAVETHDARAAAKAEAIFENDDLALAASYVSLGGQRLDMAP